MDEVYPGLPEFCYSTLETTGETIIIKRGESGYWVSLSQLPADELNATHGVTKAQEEAMVMGSMFGWNIPGADPEMWEKTLQSLLREKERKFEIE